MTAQRVAMISGANRGIGAAIARELDRRGWRLSLGMRQPEPIPGLDPQRNLIHAYDAADAGESAWVTATLERFGAIDAIVANAGIMIPKTVIEAEDADLDAMLAINVKAPRRLAKAAWAALQASRRGRFIILASLSGKRVKTPAASLYSVSKFAAVALAHGIRHTGWSDGIRATAVCPGFVATDMARALTPRAENEMTDPVDLAQVIAMLIELPNEASVAEFAVNCQLEESF
ncbi:MAG: SDR family NAD(P)-dependent oxidoreductase [Azospirillaceae bacterium]|nr:SDR family NAD(P)-dependent oxidoreductase [Azospirillaceae bacterium]